MMAVGDKFIAVGPGTISPEDKQRVMERIEASGKTIIELNNNQVYNSFAGNMLQLSNHLGESVLAISKIAYESLDSEQVNQLSQFNQHIVQANIPTIELVGGGSARCMIAELF